MLFSGDLAVFMQPRCCLVAVKPSPIVIKFEDCAKSDLSPRVHLDTGALDLGGAESLSALTAGWPPCNQNISSILMVFVFVMIFDEDDRGKNLCQSDTTYLVHSKF